MSENNKNRTLTDADVEAIANVLEQRIVERFYTNLGMGVFGVFWKGVITLVIVLSAYGATQNWWHK